MLLLAIAVHVVLPQLATLESTADELRRMRWWAVALALMAQAISIWAYGYTIRSVARLTGDTIGGFVAARVALAAASVGVLSGGPVGFGAAAHRWLRDRGITAEGAMLCSVLPGLLNLTVLGALTTVGVTYLFVHHVLGHSQTVTLASVAIVVGCFLVAAAWVLSNVERTRKVIAALRHGWRRVRRRPRAQGGDAEADRKIVDAYTLLRGGGWHRPLVGAVGKLGFDAATLFCLFVGIGDVLHPGALLAGYALPQLVGNVSFLPGGLGIVEGGMTGLFVAMQVPSPTAVLAVLAYRGLSFWAPMLLGLPLAFGLERSWHDGAHATSKPAARQ
ncbi:MAG TPA: lysylphosphatidylglycerol synthase transmembrane domain-containing protein [Gemmatimonadaceae bacterium]|nr:lysylphosphatidylglycerol synthase transmembrane domain-containing protein [Gemmatimonadaceae bacterium]